MKITLLAAIAILCFATVGMAQPITYGANATGTATFTTPLTNQGGTGGTIAWPAGAPTLTIPSGGGTAVMSTGPVWISKSAAYNPAVCGDYILADTHATAAFTITLPSSPAAGCAITIADSYPYFSTNNLTVARNGQNIQGVAGNLVLSINNSYVILTYLNSTIGWKVVNY